MNIKEEYQRLASEPMNNDNFAHFMTIAKKISKHYYENQKQNVKQVLLQRASNKQSKKLESIEPITEKEKIERMYGAIIQSDPMLYLESLLSQKQLQYFKVKELFMLHPTLLDEYQSQIAEVFSRKSVELDDSQIIFFNRLSSELNVKVQSPNIPNIQMNKLVRNALNNGARDKTVKEADEQIPFVTNNLADLDEFIEFIDPKMVNDSRFLALLRKYKTLYMSYMDPQEYVEYVENYYKKQIETTNVEPIDKTEEDRII